MLSRRQSGKDKYLGPTRIICITKRCCPWENCGAERWQPEQGSRAQSFHPQVWLMLGWIIWIDKDISSGGSVCKLCWISGWGAAHQIKVLLKSSMNSRKTFLLLFFLILPAIISKPSQQHVFVRLCRCWHERNSGRLFNSVSLSCLVFLQPPICLRY